MERWKDGIMEGWKDGILEMWKNGKLSLHVGGQAKRNPETSLWKIGQVQK